MNSHRRQYQTDSEGRRTAVVLSIAEHERLLGDLHDLGEIAERHDEPTVDDRELKRRLAEGGAV